MAEEYDTGTQTYNYIFETEISETKGEMDPYGAQMLQIKPLSDTETEHDSGNLDFYIGGSEFGKSEEMFNDNLENVKMDAVPMSEHIRMVPEILNHGENRTGQLDFIKTEEGKMKCTSCLCILENLEVQPLKCSKYSIRKPECLQMCSSLPKYQETNVYKQEIPDSTVAVIKSEPSEIDNSHNCTKFTSSSDEELIACSECNLFFNDRCLYLDHKLYTCPSISSGHTASVAYDDSRFREIAGEGAYIKVERQDELASDQDDNNKLEDNKDDAPNDRNEFNEKSIGFDNLGSRTCSSETFTCSCPYCKSEFKDFVALNVHRLSCKRPGIGTNMKELSFRSIACFICSEKFKTRHEYSQHIVSSHILKNSENGKKRKLSETDCKTLVSKNSSLQQETKRKNKSECYFNDCREKLDFKSHYYKHLRVQGSRKEITKNGIAKWEGFKLSNNQDKSHENNKIMKEDSYICNEDVINKIQKFTESDIESPELTEGTCIPSVLKVSSKIHDKDKDMVPVKKIKASFSSEGKSRNSAIRPCPVDDCANSFDSSKALQRHLHQVHGVTKGNNNKTVHQCQNTGCGLLFETRDLLKKHIQDAHLLSSTPNYSHPDLIQFVCSFCFRIFHSDSNVKEHLTVTHGVNEHEKHFIVEKLNQCKTCSSFIDSEKFNEHYKRCQKLAFLKLSLQNSNYNSEKKSSESATYKDRKQAVSVPQELHGNARDIVDKFNDKAERAGIESDLRNEKQKTIELNGIGSEKDNQVHVQETTLFYVEEGKKFRCGLCKYLLSRKTYLLTHLIESHAVLDHLPPVGNCSQDMLKMITEIRQHALLREQKSQATFVCDMKDCGMKFRKKAYLDMHRSEHCLKECRLCNFQYTKLNDYNAHLKREHSKPFTGEMIKRKCALCEFCYFKIEEYKSHLVVHDDKLKFVSQEEADGKPYVMYACPIVNCKERFESITDVVLHENLAHVTYFASENKQNEVTIVVPKHFTAPFEREIAEKYGTVSWVNENRDSQVNTSNDKACKKQKDSAEISENKIESSDRYSKNMVQNKESETKETNLACHLCFTEFSSQNLLFAHLQQIHQFALQNCRWQNCDATFLTASGLKSHVRDHFLYQLCTQKYGNENILRTTHCPFCSFQFSQTETFRKHLFENHWGYFQNSTLRLKSHEAHLASEGLELDNNLLPYKCPVKGCSKAYLYHRDLKKHTNSKDHIFSCTANGCNSVFENPGALEYHIKLGKHNIKHKEGTYKHNATGQKDNEILCTVSGYKIELVDDSED